MRARVVRAFELAARALDAAQVRLAALTIHAPMAGTVQPDAIQELELATTVKKIAEEKRGEKTYTVRVKLEEIDPRLRWGMTTLVTAER